MSLSDYWNPLNDEEKRQCFFLLQHVVNDFLSAPDQQVTFTTQNRMDLCSFLDRLDQPTCDEVNNVLRSEISVHCDKISQMLNNKIRYEDYILCFTSYLENYLISIKNITDTMFPQVIKRPDRKATKNLLEDIFRSLVIKTQQDRLSSILVSANTPKVNVFNLSNLLTLMKLKKTEVMEKDLMYKRLREEEEMEDFYQYKRMRTD